MYQKKLNLVDSVSHTSIRNILLKHGIKYQTIKGHSGKQPRSRIRFKKKRIEELRYGINLPPNSVLLYEDEKGPVAAKTYGGPSWSHPHNPKLVRLIRPMDSKRVWGL